MDAVDTVAVVLTILLAGTYAPMNAAQTWFFIRNRRVKREAQMRYRLSPQAPGRRLLVLITTNGKATDVVEHMLAVIRGYGLSPVKTGVLREASDSFPYTADRVITVPAEFTTFRGSLMKMRAQHFGSLWLAEHGYGSETYVVHLDDDSIPSKAYLDYVFRMEGVLGQGALKLRAYGKHLFSTLADFARVSNCETYCSFFNSRGHPMEVHGEGLVIRADIEAKHGWDFGTFGAEDLLMGQQLVSAGYRFEMIPEDIFIAPPTCARDFYKQRRRWTYSVVWSWSEIIRLRRHLVRWVIYRYSLAWLGVAGMGFMFYDLIVRPPIPPLVIGVGVANLVCYFGFYLYGCLRTDRRYWWKMILLQIPVSLFECGTLLWAGLYPPNRRVFDSILKV